MDVEILRYRGVGGVGGIFALLRDKPGSPHPTEENRSEWPGPLKRFAKAESDEHSHQGQETTASTSSSDGSSQSAAPDSASTSTGEPETLESMYGELQGQIVEISISHDGEYATAVCLAPDEPMTGDVGGEAAARMP